MFILVLCFPATWVGKKSHSLATRLKIYLNVWWMDIFFHHFRSIWKKLPHHFVYLINSDPSVEPHCSVSCSLLWALSSSTKKKKCFKGTWRDNCREPCNRTLWRPNRLHHIHPKACFADLIEELLNIYLFLQLNFPNMSVQLWCLVWSDNIRLGLLARPQALFLKHTGQGWIDMSFWSPTVMQILRQPFYTVWLGLDIEPPYLLSTNWKVSVATSIENCQVPKAGIESLIIFLVVLDILKII